MIILNIALTAALIGFVLIAKWQSGGFNMKWIPSKKKFVPTTTEKLKRCRKEWKAKRDALPLNDLRSFDYFNGGVDALTNLLDVLVWGEQIGKDKNDST